MKTLLLCKKDVEELLSMEIAMEAVEDAYKAYQTGQVLQPDIVSMDMPEHNGETDIKSCCNKRNGTITVKMVSGFYDNGKVNDLPTMLGNLVIYDGTTGAPLCIMDASLITGIRTGAAGGISAKYLARKNSSIVAVFGCGGQARMQVYALCKLLDIKEVHVYSDHANGLAAYQKEVEARAGVPVHICSSAEEAMERADIAVSATPSKKYLVDSGLVRPGLHIIAVGADMEGKNEWDPLVFGRAKVINDSIAQCVSRGETRNAIVAGVIREEDIYGEIGEIILGSKPGRESQEEITLFDTTGMGVQDNTAAAACYELAKQKGIGTFFEFI